MLPSRPADWPASVLVPARAAPFGLLFLLALVIHALVEVLRALLRPLPLAPVDPAQAQDEVENRQTEDERRDEVHEKGQETRIAVHYPILLLPLMGIERRAPPKGSRVFAARATVFRKAFRGEEPPRGAGVILPQYF